MAQQDQDQIVCNDGCKRTMKDDEAATTAAWSFLPIQKRWRCPDCDRELREANERMSKS